MYLQQTTSSLTLPVYFKTDKACSPHTPAFFSVLRQPIGTFDEASHQWERMLCAPIIGYSS